MALPLLLLSAAPPAVSVDEVRLYVDCAKGADVATGTERAPFRSVARAQAALSALRRRPLRAGDGATVYIRGVCELSTPLVLNESGVRYVGEEGAMLSAGTRVEPSGEQGGVRTVDLGAYNFSAANLGELSGRGYSGGSACIDVDNFEPSAAELFFRADGPASAAGARSYGPEESGGMWLARYPDRAGGLPSTDDWAGIDSVRDLTLTIGAYKAKLAAWKAELASGGQAWMHGLWSWNWADSHRPVVSVGTDDITVGADDINRDVNPIHAHKPGQQGGYVYTYGLRSELDSAGEYHIDAATGTLSFLPPAGGAAGSYAVSRLESAVVARGVSNVTLEGLEIRHARGAGVVVSDSAGVVLKGCTVSDHGMMGVNITGGAGCGVEDSEVAGNGDAGVVLYGGDRAALTPGGHFVRNCTVHHNQRWIMNYAPDVFLGGVGQSVEGSEIYGSPQIAVFMQGNDHTLADSHIHDAGRQCSDCGAFYMGREWTYRGNQILRSKFSRLDSIFGNAHGQTSAVYLDDQLSSVRVEGCTFEQIEGRVLELGGGRYNAFVNNVIQQSAATQAMSFDDRGGGGTKCCKPGALPFGFLGRVPYNTSAAWRKYPGLPGILSDDPCTPKHNVISGNILCGGARAFSVDPKTVERWGSEMSNNTARADCPQ